VTGRSSAQAGLGRGALVALAALLALVAGAAIAWHAITTRPPVPAVSVSHASAVSAKSKMQSLNDARTRAAQTRQPVEVVQTFTDAELSSAANDQAESRKLPFSHMILHATAGGALEGVATVKVAGQDVPVSLEIVPSVTTDNHLVLTVTNVDLGMLPLPGPMVNQVRQSVKDAMNVGILPPGFTDVHVNVTEGRVTISGVAQPS